jgi:hypothetical protein
MPEHLLSTAASPWLHAYIPHLLACHPCCREELQPWLAKHAAECRRAAEADEQQSSWQHYLACSTLPLPGDRRAMSAYLRSLQDAQPAGLATTLVECEVSGAWLGVWQCMLQLSLHACMHVCCLPGRKQGSSRGLLAVRTAGHGRSTHAKSL